MVATERQAESRGAPVERLIEFCARRPVYTLFVVFCRAFAGYRALQTIALDAIPDLSDVQVIVLTEWPGRSPDLVEDQITYPLTSTLLAAPKVQFVRGQSFMGLSFVYVIFEDGTDIYWARSRVAELLNTIGNKLPDGVQPALGPDATGIGWIFQYALVDKSGQHDLGELRALQDFSLRYWLESVEGVAEFPEVERVFGKMGRATTATDPAPLSMAEIVVTLKPKDAWREGVDWDRLIEEMDEKLSYPGMPNIWWMPVQTRVEMLTTGIRSSLGIKVFGDDLDAIEATAVAIEQALRDDARTAPYTRSAFAERLTGGYFLDFDIDRSELARYGMHVAQVENAIMAAVGGVPATQVLDGRERHAVTVRFAREFRDDPKALERLTVPLSSMDMGHMGGRQVPITQVADIHFRTGPPMLRNEDGQLVGFVFVDVSDEIGIADYVDRAREVVREQVDVPPGFRVAWAGQFKHFERARERLQLLVPLTLLIVFFMLYAHRGSLADALLVMAMVPFSLVGSVWLIYLLGYKLSVAVWVGMIAMAGLAAEMGLIMLFYLDHALRQAEAETTMRDRSELLRALTQGAGQRVRPMLMTSITLLVSLVPVMLNEGTGSDVMKRIAAPMVGGITSALIVVVLLMPSIFALRKAYSVPAERAIGRTVAARARE